MSISSLIGEIEASLDNFALSSVSRWKEKNPSSKAIGYFPVYVPVEMIHAAGMLPVMVAGSGGTQRRDYADGYLQSAVCSVGRSTLEMKLDGSLDILDGMVFPSICEIPRAISGIWHRHGEEPPVIYIHLPQNIKSPSAESYLVNELGRLREWLEGISGRKITDDDLRKSFEVYNRRIELLRKLDLMRSDNPELLKASEFYLLRLAGMRTSPEEHVELLEKVFTELTRSTYSPRLRYRVVLVGAFCERPPLAMLQTIENEGLAIVADDILLGQRWWLKSLPLEGDPLKALAEHYRSFASHSSVAFHPETRPCDDLLRAFHERKADGVILASSKSCQPAMQDQSCIVKACEDEGIFYIRIQFDEEQRVFESIRVQVEALLEARMKSPLAGVENGNTGGQG